MFSLIWLILSLDISEANSEINKPKHLTVNYVQVKENLIQSFFSPQHKLINETATQSNKEEIFLIYAMLQKLYPSSFSGEMDRINRSPSNLAKKEIKTGLN